MSKHRLIDDPTHISLDRIIYGDFRVLSIVKISIVEEKISTGTPGSKRVEFG